MSNNSEPSEIHEFKDQSEPFDFYLIDLPIDCVLICSLQGYIINVNKRFCDVFNVPLEEVKGKHFDETIFSRIVVEDVHFSFKHLLNSSLSYFEGGVKLANDDLLFVEIRTKLTSNNSIGLFFTNITKQKKLEDDLIQLTLKLEKLNEDKNRFISILAHDLKGPFNTILGFLDLLKENIADTSKEDIEKKITIIQNVSKNTYKLLENTLAWVSSETGRMHLHKENYSLQKLFQEVIGNLNSQAEQKNISIELVDDEAISLNCDVNMIKTVLRNLISNAIKFSSTGGKIKVSGHSINEAVEISISDTGVGISNELQSKLFNITDLISTSGTSNEKGTGLGLILCKEFIEKHEGKLEVHSEVGVGTTFKFTIPSIAIEL